MIIRSFLPAHRKQTVAEYVIGSQHLEHIPCDRGGNLDASSGSPPSPMASTSRIASNISGVQSPK